jgi:hypothetical protein
LAGGFNRIAVVEQSPATVLEEQVFDLLCAEPAYPNSVQRWRQVPPARFIEHWPGCATAVEPYHFQTQPEALYHEYIQRSGLRPEDYLYQGFLARLSLLEGGRTRKRLKNARAAEKVCTKLSPSAVDLSA